MGLLDFLTGSKPPVAGVPRLPPAELRLALLAANRDTAPYRVRDGAPESADLVAAWRIAEPAWHEAFARARLRQIFQVLLRLDPDHAEVRALDREWDVVWDGGMPRLSLTTEALRGQRRIATLAGAYAFDEQAGDGKVYSYHFRTGEMKAPLQEIVARAGWGWRGVTFGKL